MNEHDRDYAFPGSHDEPKMPAFGALLGTDFTRFVVVRHGQTTHSVADRFAGRIDISLTDQGHRESMKLGQRLAELDTPIDVVLRSPLGRCRQTWEGIQTGGGDAFHRLDAITVPELIEIDFGQWDDRDFADIYAQHGKDIFSAVSDPTFRPPDGENAIDVDRRVQTMLHHSLATYTNKTILVVTHVSPVRCLLRWALSAGPEYLYIQHVDTASLSIFDVYPNGAVSVQTINSTDHLR